MMGEKHHRVTILHSNDLIECKIERTNEKVPIPIDQHSVRDSDLTMGSLMSDINKSLETQFSQWVYVKRGLKLYDDENIYLYKQPRLIDWTRTQAILDAGEIIKQNLSQSPYQYEIN